MPDLRIPRPAKELDAGVLWDVIEPAWDHLRTPYENDPELVALTPGQRAIYALYWLHSEISNGGLWQFLFNPTGMLLPNAIEGCALVGDDALEAALRNVATLFGSTYPIDRDERIELLNDDEFDPDFVLLDEDDNVFERLQLAFQTPEESLLISYLNAHPEEFFR